MSMTITGGTLFKKKAVPNDTASKNYNFGRKFKLWTR